MSIHFQLLPTTRAYQQKQQQEEAVEGRQHEKLIAKSPTKHRQKQTNWSAGQISSPPSSPISLQFAQSPKLATPFITIPGGIKRSRPPEMDLPKMSHQNSSSAETNFFDDDFVVDADGPKLKQRRYEERMSHQLGGIYISPEKQSTSKIEQQKSRPKIEEIVDWDEELLEDESELIRQAISAPIIEEPRTTPTKMDELFSTTGMEGKQQKDMEGPKIVELDNKEEDDEGFIENGNEKDWTTAGPSGGIVLSEKLRQLIRQDRDGQHSPPLLTRSQIRTGKELIPYVPSPLTLQPSNSTTNAQIEEVNEADEDDEVFIDELLPETTNSPKIEECESMPPTPSTLEPTMSDDDLPRNMPSTTNYQQIGQEQEMEEEEAMEID